MTRLKAAIALMLAAAGPALAQDDAAELAKKLSNPVAALISVPMQLNFDQDIGAARQGERWSLNLQPVIPMDLDRNWNVISRTIVPVVSQKDIVPGAGSQFGLGDIVQSVFFSPKAPTASGWIWGAGPVLLLPTGTDDLLSAKKWGAGPTAVVLKQAHGWTYGALGNHLWSFAGDSQRSSISSTFVQSFVSYTTPDAWSFTFNSESTYDWKARQWTVPLNLMASKVTKVGGQLISVGGGVRYWADGPQQAPHGWGARFVVTLLFPK
ncbi:MAG: transporter [Betaproteobacteria bacterium]